MSELQRVIAKGEGVQLDFKYCIDDKQKISRTLVAFANTSGGRVLIGVKDNGKIKGVNPEEELYMIEGASSSYCEPEVKFNSKIWEEGHHLVLEIDVPQSEVKHKAIDEDGSMKYFVRVEEITLKANKIVQKIWTLQKHGQSKPSEFNEDTLILLRFIQENQPLSISKLYKIGLPLKFVDRTIAQLVYWSIVDMTMSDKETYYSIPVE
ncbi:MAG: ATP-binding protein [Crocinitomicaceae bacterium]|nr:ATP-binding protein [Crocinitomicaceae bacterium]